ncbi:RES family NAD+ phosphorylase [Kiloniella laminariae]|uniref:RES family NAD+ phosphorylase n=1 Tax=Kiloniella laminariae TaxID=454162 RepID=A0ABT4LFH6_9PROT|nr:RES family NAD+ phosphorylase [Kiloniella laminariae]MCZ4279863.1 RES family NAD+ phosphorylase [Kiloniella laminariae]
MTGRTLESRDLENRTTDPASLPRVNFTEPDTCRLISTAYLNEPALQPLADSPDDLAILEELEMMTSPRHQSLVALPAGLSPDELIAENARYGWSYINAAFCYTHARGNRFNGPERGAWYATFGKSAVKTAQSEVAFHLSNELKNTNSLINTTRYRELLAGFSTDLHDLSKQHDQDYLAPDPARAYPAGQSLARNLFRAEANGVIYPSVRHKGGRCIAIFRPHLIQNIRPGQSWEFCWSGSLEPEIRPLEA